MASSLPFLLTLFLCSLFCDSEPLGAYTFQSGLQSAFKIVVHVIQSSTMVHVFSSMALLSVPNVLYRKTAPKDGSLFSKVCTRSLFFSPFGLKLFFWNIYPNHFASADLS